MMFRRDDFGHVGVACVIGLTKVATFILWKVRVRREEGGVNE